MGNVSFPLITAHTGCMGTPENSLASVRAGLEHRADIVEDDIRATKDGTLVLGHDDVLRLPDGRLVSLAASTFRELSALPVPSPVRLEQALLLVKEAGAQMNLDIKTDAALEPLAGLVAALGMAGRVFLTGCELPRALLARSRAPGLRRLLNVRADSFAAHGEAEASRQACEEALEAGCSGLNVPYSLVSASLLQRAEDAGLPVYVWTVDEPEPMRRCAEWGVRSVTTRNVAALRAVKAGWR